MSNLVKAFEHDFKLSRDAMVPLTKIHPGDTVRVHFRIVEGKRERVQPFQGVVIRKREGGLSSSITVRRVASHGVGVERTFPLHAPRLEPVSYTHLVDLDHPLMFPGHNLSADLVYSALGRAVKTTVCDGRVLLEGGLVADEAEIRTEVSARLARLLMAAGLA